MASKAIIITNDTETADTVMKSMQALPYDFIHCSTFMEGLDHLVTEDISLTVIQLTSPWYESIHSLYPIRWVNETCLVAMMYPGTENDKAHILDVADGCIWLPPSQGEIEDIKLKASSRRQSCLASHSKKEYFYFRGLLVFPMQWRLFFGDVELFPSRVEYELLNYLILHRDSIVSREQLLEKVWHLQYNSENEKTVSVHIHALRRMLAEVTDEPFIETVRGFGYKFFTGMPTDKRRINVDAKKKFISPKPTAKHE